MASQQRLMTGEEPVTQKRKQPPADSTRRANSLDGKTWQRNSISVWSDIRKTPEETKLGHPAIFPVDLVLRIIKSFTRDDERLILDPFSGIGSTAIAAELLGKIGVGLDVSESFTERARGREIPINYSFDEQGVPSERSINGSVLPLHSGERRLHVADARDLLEFVEAETVDLVVTSPPYWDILLQRRSADQKAIRNYGEEEPDLGKIRDYGAFIESLKDVFGPVYQALRPGKYCIVVVMDLRKKDIFYPFHSDVAAMMQALGFIYDDIIIWDRRHEYNNMRPLGYPYKFRVNKAHEFILIFQKPGQRESHRVARD